MNLKGIAMLITVLISLQVNAQYIRIKGKITDCDTMLVLFQGAEKTDTLITYNGEFSFSRKAAYPELCHLYLVKNNQSIKAIKSGNEASIRSRNDVAWKELFLEAGATNIHSTFAGFQKASIDMQRRTSQNLYDEYQARFTPLFKMARAIIDTSDKVGTEQEKQLCRNLYNRVVRLEDQVAEKFILANTGNIVGAYVLYYHYRINNYALLDSIYHLFDSRLQSSYYLRNIKDKILALQSLKPGDPIPAFLATDMNGKPVTPENFKGRFVVLDFWFTGCPPCIKGFPKMKEYADKYKDRLELVSISCSDKEPVWRNFITSNQLTWTHVLDTRGPNSLATLFNIETYPTKMIIDAQGKLVRIFTGETAEFYTTIDDLLNRK
jgi:thiol-disulfide isomerase/thioredoxin